ncbi:hypothetical protein A5481_29995 [Methylobacterium platani]|uniref:Uncharacterized protein n=3 Tax=Methylobacterium platani TaxID=427683 RepID=A0A179RXS2_9HYPH|nr:hypothetical protein A5481_29995 [Methylobacterium platani]
MLAGGTAAGGGGSAAAIKTGSETSAAALAPDAGVSPVSPDALGSGPPSGVPLKVVSPAMSSSNMMIIRLFFSIVTFM